jgi:3-isopropylmalate/(R)-2-methylmalate dehydratase small subunit
MSEHIFIGKAWVFGDSINTDVMYPQICYTLPENQRPLFTMQAIRPGWAKQVKRGDIIVAGLNFGVGSSRPAADNLKKLGIACVIAESINGLFFRNAINVGLFVANCPKVTSIVSEGDMISVDFDRGLVANLDTSKSIHFKPLPKFLVEIIDEGGIIPLLKKKGLLQENPL